ncbi:MAG: hypothetical protein ACOY3F_03700 [Bacillota bacterium]
MVGGARDALDVTDHAGLVQNPGPPWDYALTFNIAGLTNEYRGRAIFLRDGKLVEVPPFSEYGEVEFPLLGTLEAFTAAGGTSTAPSGWHASIMAIAMAHGVTPQGGAKPVELALPRPYFAGQMKKRGFRVKERVAVWSEW